MATARRPLARMLTCAVGAVALAGGLGLVSAGTASAAEADCAYMGYGSAPDTLAIQLDDIEQQMANMINEYRQQNGLDPLSTDSNLARPTMWASLDSVLRGFSPSDHIDSRGMGIAERAQFCSGYTGPIAEINYWGYGGGENGNQNGSAEAAFAWWKQSPTHNAIMLSDEYTHFSVGRAYDGENAERQHWTIDFGIS